MACSAGDDDSASPAPSGDVTWYKDVSPLVNAYCLECHVTGGVAPFPMDSYASARAWGAAMNTSVASRTMPPYYARNDGSCRTFSGSPWLTEQEIAVFQGWADGGFPEGDEADAPPAPTPAPGIGAGAVTFSMPEVYSPVITGGQGSAKDDYRCFLLSSQRDSDAFVTAFEVVPGNPSIVHHMIIYTLDPDYVVAADGGGEPLTNRDQIASLQAGDPNRVGWPCYGTTGDGTFPNGMLGSWAPGSGEIALPAGTGVSLRSQDWLIAQVHYNLDNGAGTDQSALKAQLAPTVEKEGYFLLGDGLLAGLSSGDVFVITPGQSSITFDWTTRVSDVTDFLETYFSDRFETAPTEFDVYAMLPHMHTLGRAFTAERRPVGGGDPTCLIDMPKWDFNWQHMYFYDEPITLDAQHEVAVTCTWDSRSRTAPTFPGTSSTDEMCLLGVYFTVHGP